MYNPGPLPVDLGGMYMTDNPVTQPYKHQIHALTFVNAFGLIVFNADDRVIAYSVASENFESIHNHSAYALIERDKRAS